MAFTLIVVNYDIMLIVKKTMFHFCLICLILTSVLGFSRRAICSDEEEMLLRLIPAIGVRQSGIDALERSERIERSGWVKQCLRPEFAPAQRMRFTLIPGESDKQLDRMMMTYSVDTNIVTLSIIQTMFVIVINRPITNLLPTSELQILVMDLFNIPEGTELKINCLEASPRGMGGNVVILKGNTNTPYWLPTLRWWQQTGRVGWYFNKEYDLRGRSIEPTHSFEGNITWFRDLIVSNAASFYFPIDKKSSERPWLKHDDGAPIAVDEQTRICWAHALEINHKIERIMLEHKLGVAEATWERLSKYINTNDLPSCPNGGKYLLDFTKEWPKCTVHGERK
jgi:hypothetical protein